MIPDFKQMGWSILYGLTNLIVIILSLRYLGKMGSVIFITMYMSAIMLYKKSWSWKTFFLLPTILSIMYGFGTAIDYYGWPAWLHFVWIGLIFIYFGYRRWSLYVWAIETVQAQVWGKSFKEFKESGEPIPKIKFRLRRKMRD